MSNIILSPEELNMLRSLPLQDVMSKNGHTPVRKSKCNTHYLYRCPMPEHDDQNASFSVELAPGTSQMYGGTPLAMFRCFGCDSIHGQGAVDLQAYLLGFNPHKAGGLTASEFNSVLEKLCTLFNLTIGGCDPNEWTHRWAWTDPQEEFSYTPAEWDDRTLEALGCKGIFVGNRVPEEDGTYSIIRARKYPWSHGVGESIPWSEITRLFSIQPIADFTTPAKKDRFGTMRSRRFRATETYPIFVIKTVDREGHWRIKKYEPMFHPASDGASYKWSWFYQGNRNLASLYEKVLYGDCDVISALYNDDVLPSDSSQDGSHPTVSVPEHDRDGNLVSKTKFKRVVICSGPRDALNVYFHSDCHVLYPDSETSRIDPRVMSRLREIAQDVYLLFDTDLTGVARSRAINLEHLWLRNIELPESLADLTDPRTGKPCNDATDYFTRFQSRLGYGIDYDFEQRLSSTVSLQFWKREPRATRYEKSIGQHHYSYSLMADSMLKFLHYSGLSKFRDKGLARYVYIQDHLVETVTDVPTKAKKLMKEWLSTHSRWADPELNNVISSGKMLRMEVLAELRDVKLNFQSWTKDEEWFFFSNGALRVDKDSRQLLPYSQLQFYVDRASILPHPYIAMDDTLLIEDNPELQNYERAHQMRLDDLAPGDAKGRADEDNRWKEDEVLWAMRLSLLTPMNQQSIAVQYLYDTCRMYWQEEQASRRAGKPRAKWLTAQKQQHQDMLFISKCVAIGYLLTRQRVWNDPRMVLCVDYCADPDKKAQGRSGKSILGGLLSFVRQVYTIAGKEFKTNPETFARNFKGLDCLVHGVININDPHTHVDPELLYGLAEGELRKKNLFRDEEELPAAMVPKVILSSNTMFDVSNSSTNGRLWTLYFGDYYHVGDTPSDNWDPGKKFGTSIKVGEMDSHETSRTINFLLQCVQTYMRLRRYVAAPTGSNGRRIQLLANPRMRDKQFPGFMDSILADELVMGIPIAKRDLVAVYKRFRGQPTTKSEVEAYSHGSEFNTMLSLYCASEHIVVNPDIVYRNPTEKGKRVVRSNVYTYNLRDDRPMSDTDRSLCKSVPSLLFYKMGTEPRNPEDVMRDHCTDPFAEGYCTHSMG